jgi:ubiquinone/menaquinone biosynthesis C-methylase UbiE
MDLNSKDRFSNRVADYARYRPGYPSGVLETLRDECGLTRESVIADVGSGTGLLTKIFLQNGNVVYGIEPNAAMREAAEEFLKDFPRLRSVDASAEATSLRDASVDFVTAGQAFHWFDIEAARREFRRILRPDGWVAVVGNNRLEDTPLHREYERLLRAYGTDYDKVAATYPKYQKMKEFFQSAAFSEKTFPNEQIFDYAGLRGRLLSASYAPPAGHPNHEPMLAGLKDMFDRFQQNGVVHFEYETKMQYGQLDHQL